MIVVGVENQGGERIVTVAPVTHTPPNESKDGIEIPGDTKRRLGLDERQSWIVTTEVNRFPWPGPDLRPVSRRRPDVFAYGGLPRKLMVQLIDRLSEQHRLKTVPRE